MEYNSYTQKIAIYIHKYLKDNFGTTLHTFYDTYNIKMQNYNQLLIALKNQIQSETITKLILTPPSTVKKNNHHKQLKTSKINNFYNKTDIHLSLYEKFINFK